MSEANRSSEIMKLNSYKVYKRRYLVLFTVVLLNISNACVWITYSPVASDVANFYGIETSKVNWFSTVYMIISIPFCFISTFLMDRFGLKSILYLGSFLNCGGSLLKAIGTSSLLSPGGASYGISLLGQVLAASAQAFILFVPTKASQLWFPEYQRGLSTTLMAMSNPLGILVASGISPIIISSPDKVPENNYIWAGLAIVTEMCTLFFIRSSYPPTPASRSAEQGEKNRPPYTQQLKDVFTSVPYWILFFSLGGGVGLFNAFATLTQQFLCPLGYTETVASLSSVSMIMFGFIGSVVAGIMADKTKQFIPITKLFFAVANIAAIIVLELFLVPNIPVLVILSCGLFGFFGIGSYPVGLELSVETTYPVEEMISTAFIFMSGQLHGILFVVLTPVLAREGRPSDEYHGECKLDAGEKLKDYTAPALFLMIYFTCIVCFAIAFFKTDYKRLKAEREQIEKNLRSPSPDGCE